MLVARNFIVDSWQ